MIGEEFLANQLSIIIHNTSNYKVYSPDEMLDTLINLLKLYNRNYKKNMDITDYREQEHIKIHRLSK